ncbi:UDP-diphospho-muramoylpentapeptide beta-N- acetylglucosaminyltransferase [Gordoniibacillus kamchatkensis]|uniref:UDP-N-acetylglucosamine--N-acetylmuramyl-(pentapeptide) pyrophosphoryl-undecaprenol N-acetylglucosamine transferase n=1 Tax=Gordoniibacillus kamchatkensis TaxID=1590651 RepID=A0ABR5ALA5_9BACL|nr:undecaprenyldiphospho-muramoylpentapeptide beta-N-acetylglucosaminyltransferase [Paenibacillus sp. VKM B-2647]KIL41750.1 UDP-diphospho-muramoylpentapeptide beta-N- acetylglucosaminyltransferase [Paenibacillus sp. VKM B-2647]
MHKIVFTGGGSAGHVTPNLALISRLQKLGWSVDYIGSNAGIEKEIIEHEGIPFHHISSGKLRRYFDLKNFKDPFKVMRGVVDACVLLRKLKPDVVFSKGGFVSVPVVVGAWMNRIPVLIHESDMTPGLANKLSVPFAKQVCVTFPETLQHVKGGKAVCTGLPIRDGLAQGSALRGLTLCDFHRQKPVLLIMGGSLGAQKINESVRASLDELLPFVQVAHICGKGNVDSAFAGKRGYKQFEYVQEELPDLLAAADFVVSRAGSTSIFEFLSLRKPMLLIPLSRQASRGDQILNAESFRARGYAAVLAEEELTPASLAAGIRDVQARAGEMREAMQAAAAVSGTDAVLELIRKSAGA